MNSIGTPPIFPLTDAGTDARIGVDRALFGERLGDAVDEGERSDTDDDRIGTDPADQQSLQAGQQRAKQQPNDQTQAEAQPVRCQDEHHRGHAHGGAERERHDVAADRDERHADRHAADERHRGEKREDARPGQEAWRGEDDGKKDDYADGLSPGEHPRPVEAHPPQISCRRQRNRHRLASARSCDRLRGMGDVG